MDRPSLSVSFKSGQLLYSHFQTTYLYGYCEENLYTDKLTGAEKVNAVFYVH